MAINMDKKIIIDDKHRAQIAAELDTVQARAKVRTITVDEIYSTCAEIERKLSIPKKHLIGCRFRCDLNSQDYPNAYRQIPEATIFRVEYKNNKWYLTDVCRTQQPKNGGSDKQIRAALTDAARAAIVKRFEQFGV